MTIHLILEKLDVMHRDIDLRLKSLEGRMESLEARMVTLEDKVQTLEGRIQKLESQLQKLYSHVEKIDVQVQKLFQLYSSHHSELEAFHYYMARHDQEIFANEEKIMPLIPLPQKVHTLEKTVAFHGRILKKAL